MIISFDIGGTFIKYAIFENIRGLVPLFSGYEETGSEPILRIKSITETSLKKYNIKKAGIAVAANVNNTGEIINSTNINLPFKFNFVKYFWDNWRIECKVINDGSASALGLCMYDEFSHFKNFVSVTLGTGVGGGIIIGKKLLNSGNGFEGEIGHIIIEEGGFLCGCGKKGCLEAYCGAHGIVKRYKKHMKIEEFITPEDLSMFAKNKDLIAIKVIEETGNYLGKAFSIISDIIGPEAFILNGGVTGFGDKLLESVNKVLRERCFSRVSNSFPQVLFNTNSNPALLGNLLFLKGENG